MIIKHILCVCTCIRPGVVPQRATDPALLGTVPRGRISIRQDFESFLEAFKASALIDFSSPSAHTQRTLTCRDQGGESLRNFCLKGSLTGGRLAHAPPPPPAGPPSPHFPESCAENPRRAPLSPLPLPFGARFSGGRRLPHARSDPPILC